MIGLALSELLPKAELEDILALIQRMRHSKNKTVKAGVETKYFQAFPLGKMYKQGSQQQLFTIHSIQGNSIDLWVQIFSCQVDVEQLTG